MSEVNSRSGHSAGDKLAGYLVVVPSVSDRRGFDPRRLIGVIAQTWRFAVLGGVVGAAAALVVALQMKPIYRVEATVISAQNVVGSQRGVPGQLSGLAALAGVNLLGGQDHWAESVALLSSKSFARTFIEKKGLMPLLFPKRWDESKRAWRSDASVPTMESAVRLFMNDIGTISEDRNTGLLSVMLEFESPDLAAKWANEMIDLANEMLREHAIEQSRRSIEYLNKEIEKTTVVELRQAIFGLIETQLNAAMLANVQFDFAFRFVDRAVPPDLRAWPKVKWLTVLGGILGGVVGCLVAWSIATYRRWNAAGHFAGSVGSADQSEA